MRMRVSRLGPRDTTGESEAMVYCRGRQVPDRLARHLISQLLSRDPAARPPARAVLAHPFLTGRPPTRLPGDAAEFDVFLSYRVSSDSELARALYRYLAGPCELRVWFISGSTC